MPGMPSVLRWTGSGASCGSTFMSPSPGSVAYSWTPTVPLTWSPSAKRGSPEATTWPIPSARITSPIPTGGT